MSPSQLDDPADRTGHHECTVSCRYAVRNEHRETSGLRNSRICRNGLSLGEQRNEIPVRQACCDDFPLSASIGGCRTDRGERTGGFVACCSECNGNSRPAAVTCTFRNTPLTDDVGTQPPLRETTFFAPAGGGEQDRRALRTSVCGPARPQTCQRQLASGVAGMRKQTHGDKDKNHGVGRRSAVRTLWAGASRQRRLPNARADATPDVVCGSSIRSKYAKTASAQVYRKKMWSCG